MDEAMCYRCNESRLTDGGRMPSSAVRAGEVVIYLVAQGVNPNIISAKGFGDTHPVAPNDTPANRAKNRRIGC
jgi:flagellar motor protein MotB